MITKIGLSSSQNSATGMCSVSNPSNAEYADDSVLVIEVLSKLKVFLDHPDDGSGTFRMFFAFEVQRAVSELDWLEAGEELGEVDGFSYVGNWSSPGGHKTGEVPWA